MAWRVELTSNAARQLRRLPATDRDRLIAVLEALQEDPRRAGKRVKATQGTRDNYLRYRVGDFRVVYDLDDPAGVVLVHGAFRRRDLETWLRRHR